MEILWYAGKDNCSRWKIYHSMWVIRPQIFKSEIFIKLLIISTVSVRKITKELCETLYELG